MPRKVIGAKYRQHAMRAVTKRRRAVGQLTLMLAGAGVIGLDGNRDFVNHRRHFRRRFPAWLAGFTGDNGGQIRFIALQQHGEFFHNRLPLAEGASGPGRKRGAGSTSRLHHLRGIGIVTFPEHVALHRILLHPTFTLTGHPVTVNP
ncbi:hypothetical protein SDC9_187151 [bioreactor metagenome]|uniref:Uncharacterized protein n=1 Tax=bioreactor metagenome TaxID=1076179 RepID=A0A645HWA3_9ZZZZ